MNAFIHGTETTLAYITFFGVCIGWPALWVIIALGIYRRYVGK